MKDIATAFDSIFFVTIAISAAWSRLADAHVESAVIAPPRLTARWTGSQSGGGVFRWFRRSVWCGSTVLNDDGGLMFRVEMRHRANALMMKIEGQLSGNYAEHTRTLITRCNTELPLVVDLTDVTFVDSAGEEALSFVGRLGAEFIADNAYSRDLCERLNLRLSSQESLV